MTLETEKYDPVYTHWVTITVGSTMTDTDRKLLENNLERVFIEMNHRALKEGKVILSINQSCVSDGDYIVIYTTTAQIVDRKVLEQQQLRQQLTRN